MTDLHREAFERLVTEHQAAACAVAYAVLRDRARSEDVAQDALLVAWQQRDRMPAHAAAWLCTIARNLARNAARRKGATSLVGDVAAEATPLHSMLDAEQERLAAEALAALDDDDREALVLYYRGGQSMRQVAEALDVGEAAARKRVQRGRDRLRERLDAVERGLARTKPAAAFGAACLVAWLAMRDAQAATVAGATGATGATAAGVASGKAVAVAVAIAAGAIVLGGGWYLERQVQADDGAPAAAPLGSSSLPAPAAAEAPPPALVPSLPPAAPPPPDVLAGSAFDVPADLPAGHYPVANVLDFMSQRTRLPILFDGVPSATNSDTAPILVSADAASIDLDDAAGSRSVADTIDAVLASAHLRRDTMPGVMTWRFGELTEPCAAPFGGDPVDADFDDAPVSIVVDLIADALHVPIYVPAGERATRVTVHVHGTAGEAFDQLVVATKMGCTAGIPGIVVRRR